MLVSGRKVSLKHSHDSTVRVLLNGVLFLRESKSVIGPLLFILFSGLNLISRMWAKIFFPGLCVEIHFQAVYIFRDGDEA